jgi:ATP phosphoribosyltransferase regulatory subunit
VSRLCYAGSTLHTQPKSLSASRSPIQIGAELYGDNSLSADVEIIRLMLETLTLAGLDTLSLDLGHTGIYEAVLAFAALDADSEAVVFDALQRKSLPDLELALSDVEPDAAELIIALAGLHGGDHVLAKARELFTEKAPLALAAVDALEKVAEDIRRQWPDLDIYFDLAELRGYHYHTGIVFAAYVPGHGRALANGGRYNNVGEVFGRARPATGFATDLKALMGLLPTEEVTRGAINMPNGDDPALLAMARKMRAEGEIVINCLSAEADPRCDRQLLEEQGVWQVKPLEF